MVVNVEKSRRVTISLKRVYNTLFRNYGEQLWWPGETPFEIIIGAILTQNTAWTNVEKAIKNLIVRDYLNAEKIIQIDDSKLAELLKPTGYFNVKTIRVKNFCRWYEAQGGFGGLSDRQTDNLRKDLLGINGIGPETADDILLYAFDRPVFVIDAYTRRLFSRLGLIDGKESYETIRYLFEHKLGEDVDLYNEYHALIVKHAKLICKKRPICERCCLVKICDYAKCGVI